VADSSFYQDLDSSTLQSTIHTIINQLHEDAVIDTDLSCEEHDPHAGVMESSIAAIAAALKFVA